MALASYPLSAARNLGRLRGRPRLPVFTVTAPSSGMTCARPLPLAGVVQTANGMPPPGETWDQEPPTFPPWRRLHRRCCQ
jgi:hypothetical protein